MFSEKLRLLFQIYRKLPAILKTFIFKGVCKYKKMAYEVTASKKRPITFDQLAGQEFVAASLKKSVLNGRIAHAYLFSGPRGVGKTSAARILAKAINCEKWPSENPCGKCPSCREISAGNALDVIEIDGASNTSVNDIREIKDEVLFAPNSSRYKIYIIDEVHMLSNSAFNALLKTIEEPPPYIVFIFATTEIHKVPATIKSRCQQFNFRLISLEIIKDHLESVCRENSIKAENDALFWIAKESTGSLRDAYTLFDQVASFSDNEITLEKIKEKLGLVGLDDINSTVETFAENSVSDSINYVNTILDRGISVEQFIIELTEYFRNILLIKTGIKKEGILGFPADRFSEKAVSSFTVEQIEYALSLLLKLFRDIRYSLNQRFELELVISRLSSLDKYVSERTILEKIRLLKNELKTIDLKSVKPDDPAGDSDDIDQNGPEDYTRYRDQIASEIKTNNFALSSSVSKSSMWEKENDRLVIFCSDNFSADTLRKGKTEVAEELKKLTGEALSIEIRLEEKRTEGSVSGNSSVSDQVELVKKIFKGEVLETRIVKDDSYEFKS